MSEKILACPYCGIEEGKVFTTSAGKRFYVGSPCGASGPVADNESDAVLFWNAAANQLAAKDAEIEQLRKERHTMCIDYERVEQERDEARRVARVWYKRCAKAEEGELAYQTIRFLFKRNGLDYLDNLDKLTTLEKCTCGTTAGCPIHGMQGYVHYTTRNEPPTTPCE